MEEYERGQVVVTVCGLRGDQLRIDRADPRALISAELLAKIAAGDHHAAVSLNGDILRIEGLNQAAVYRIGAPHPNRHAYCMEWPD